MYQDERGPRRKRARRGPCNSRPATVGASVRMPGINAHFPQIQRGLVSVFPCQKMSMPPKFWPVIVHFKWNIFQTGNATPEASVSVHILNPPLTVDRETYCDLVHSLDKRIILLVRC